MVSPNTKYCTSVGTLSEVRSGQFYLHITHFPPGPVNLSVSDSFFTYSLDFIKGENAVMTLFHSHSGCIDATLRLKENYVGNLVKRKLVKQLKSSKECEEIRVLTSNLLKLVCQPASACLDYNLLVAAVS